MKELTTIETKQYLYRLKDLELSCYKLQALKDALEYKKRVADANYNKAAAAEPGEKPVRETTSSIISGTFLIGFLFGSLPGAVVGAIIGIIRWIINDGRQFKHYMLSSVIIAALILFAIVAIFYMCISISANRNLPNRQVEYDKKVQSIQENIDWHRDRQAAINTALTKCNDILKQTRDLKGQCYDLGYIYPKYRGIVPVCTIYEYLESGICSSLTGHEGAYNLYENELKWQIAFSKLDDIMYRLNDISTGQRMLAEEIEQCNQFAYEISNRIENIERCTELNAMYNAISAANLTYLSWMNYIG